MSYKKWLHSRQSSRELSPTTSKSSLGHPELQNELPKEDERVDENVNLAVLNKSNKADRKPKYHFLTEAEATVKGRFSHRHKENMELQHIPQPHAQSPLKSHSSMGFTAANSRVSTASSSESSRKGVYSPQDPLRMNSIVSVYIQPSPCGTSSMSHTPKNLNTSPETSKSSTKISKSESSHLKTSDLHSYLIAGRDFGTTSTSPMSQVDLAKYGYDLALHFKAMLKDIQKRALNFSKMKDT